MPQHPTLSHHTPNHNDHTHNSENAPHNSENAPIRSENAPSSSHNIPAAVAIYTTKGSTTTFVNGGLSSGEVLYLYENPESILEQLSPREITSGNWPSRKSLEKCDPDGPNDPDNWRVSTDPADATPGRKNSCTP